MTTNQDFTPTEADWAAEEREHKDRLDDETWAAEEREHKDRLDDETWADGWPDDEYDYMTHEEMDLP